MSEETFKCRPCSGIVSLAMIKENLLEQISALKTKSSSITVLLSSLKQQESALKNQCKQFMGATRLNLQEVLENNLSVIALIITVLVLWEIIAMLLWRDMLK